MNDVNPCFSDRTRQAWREGQVCTSVSTIPRSTSHFAGHWEAVRPFWRTQAGRDVRMSSFAGRGGKRHRRADIRFEICARKRNVEAL